ncbi:lysine N(6)-hydroxylase/L-ornithine N(5)-oxygenase family protein [Kushneria phyllosphaerae]|uniref:L-lysine N6-monooxygenase n=1 Tax=Kushneria phyllosphaerae TaxID=2100822 RepID=A0A2R8CJR6_9GAMM|nr:SidA/IucD/PvdA family monooxygenase [Kushneria phyllosphaerae]SPJ33113.1 L-lysine N6-monooxygenase [Kushneria phyllosphaerae]
MADTPELLDLAGIGAGPFNLSIAALADGLPMLSTRFFDRQRRYVWHEGMMLPDTHLQTGFLKDLVTAIDPTSRWSFLNYLVQHRRFYRFLNAELSTVSRAEFSDYLRWAAEGLDNVWLDHRVREIDHDGEHFQLKTDTRTFRARHLCLGNGKAPWLPAFARAHQGERCLHAESMAWRARDFTNQRMVIVGGGQSGADIFINALRGHWGPLRSLHWLSRRRNFQPLDETAFTNEYFTPGYTSQFAGLEDEVRRREVNAQKYASDGITPAALTEIYQTLYHRFDVMNEPRWAHLLPHREAIDMTCDDGVFMLQARHGTTGVLERFDADVVIFATGFESSLPECMAPLLDRIQRDAHGEPSMGQHFMLDWQGGGDSRIYAVNAGRTRYGIAEPQLSLMAWRSAVILNHLSGEVHFDLEDDAGPVTWTPQGRESS